MVKKSYREALHDAHQEALASDPRVFLVGEDVGRYGGTYAVSKSLLEAFGPERVMDAPLSESGFTGLGVGAALGGLRPIVEIMTVNFSLLAMDQIVNGAATIRYMSGAAFSVPLVIRMSTGAGRQLAAQHSHSLEGWYAHVPGVRVVAPATVADARGMLATALADPDPVIMFEHVGLLGTTAEIRQDAGAVDIDRAAIRRAGTDVSIITWGGCLPRSLEAADALATDGIDAEVLDLRTLRPLDVDAIVDTVSRTHRVVVVDEMWRTGSWAAEIVATIVDQAFFELDAPVRRVCSAEVPMPYAKHMEEAALPSAEKIAAAVKEIVGSHG